MRRMRDRKKTSKINGGRSQWVQRIINIEVLERVSCKDRKRWPETGVFETYIKSSSH